MGGSTNSGKTVGLQTLITSIAYSKSPSQVNFILIDVGAADLMVFDGLPHLSCPVVHDRITAIYTLAALNTEMERRIALEHTNFWESMLLPRLVVVIDEFSALFMGGIDKDTSKMLSDTISSLLQRGRHAKIHLVLAAQNPTFQNMKVDLGNITARIAFKCAKKNFSETILDESGAENLSGLGDMLLKSSQNDDLQRIQGAYITPKELTQITHCIKTHYCKKFVGKFSISFPDNLVEMSNILSDDLNCSVARKHPSQSDRQLSKAILWALKHDSVSINSLMEEQRLGWNKASNLIKRLEKLGIVDAPNAKLPREVIPKSLEDIPEELMTFLEKTGFSRDDISKAFHCRQNVILHTENICCSAPEKRNHRVWKVVKLQK